MFKGAVSKMVHKNFLKKLTSSMFGLQTNMTELNYSSNKTLTNNLLRVSDDTMTAKAKLKHNFISSKQRSIL